MEVFIGNLPGGATLIELQDFIGNFDLKADFHSTKSHGRHGHPYHFFIVSTKTRKQGLELIDKLNGHVFQSRPLSVRECIKREQSGQWNGKERRITP